MNYSVVQLESETICSWDIYRLPDGTETADSGLYQSHFTTWQNCDSIIETNLTVINCNPCTVFFPSSITTNNDGLNEEFERFGTCEFESYELYIYNRWGELLFNTTDPNATWDGKFDGDLVPGGIYIYKARYITHEKDMGTRDGYITIIR